MTTLKSEDSWILPIQISIRKWHIPLTDQDRNLLEYALCNATDELIRQPLPGATVRIHHGTAVLLYGLPAKLQILTGIEHRCRQLRKIANNYFYADVDIGIGDNVPMRELPQEKLETAQSNVPAIKTVSNEIDRMLHMRESNSSERAVLQQILNYVEEHFVEELTREDVAQFVHFHPAYLSRYFRKKTGLSLSEYIVKKRIERAKEMLSRHELKVTYIMNQLGYYNLSHFTRIFKKMTGYTPHQYRKKNHPQ